jgi:hypothetical protein
MNKKDIARDIYDMVEGDKDLFFEIAASEMTDDEIEYYWNEILDDEEAFFTSREPIEEAATTLADIEKVEYAFHYDFENLIFDYASKLGADLSKDTLPYGDAASELETKVFNFIVRSVRKRRIG